MTDRRKDRVTAEFGPKSVLIYGSPLSNPARDAPCLMGTGYRIVWGRMADNGVDVASKASVSGCVLFRKPPVGYTGDHLRTQSGNEKGMSDHPSFEFRSFDIHRAAVFDSGLFCGFWVDLDQRFGVFGSY